MSEHSIFLVLIAIIVTDFALERVLSFLNGKSAKKDIPQELSGIYDEEKYAKSQEYNQVNSRFGMLTASFSFLLLICALYFGWFGILDK